MIKKNNGMIKIITGIRRCGKSFFLKSVIQELIDSGVQEKDIINIELDKKGYKNIKTPSQLEKVIDEKIVGFCECSLRYDYIEGTSSSPVGYKH